MVITYSWQGGRKSTGGQKNLKTPRPASMQRIWAHRSTVDTTVKLRCNIRMKPQKLQLSAWCPKLGYTCSNLDSVVGCTDNFVRNNIFRTRVNFVESATSNCSVCDKWKSLIKIAHWNTRGNTAPFQLPRTSYNLHPKTDTWKHLWTNIPSFLLSLLERVYQPPVFQRITFST